ncbi:trafficking protein particle complex subunit 10 [Spinellus fusiger]|nr:trafficking protein particle complex subunit 10 [Spinellus fusiger]
MRTMGAVDCDEYGVWPLIADDLSSRLPLKNLQWQPSSQRSPRFIHSLEADLKRFSFDQTPQLLSTMQTNYLNLYFVACEDNEIYKNKVKKQIKQWVDFITTKKNQEWMVVYVAGQDAKKSNNYLGLKTTVFDKIRTDFNQGKQERCAYIRIHDADGPTSEYWVAFLDKMKEYILSSFDMHVLQAQEDTRRLDMQRHMPGWNYCTFFILKEGLAQAFEIMTLYEDALIQYDELEASFFQVLRDKALAWFGHFGGTDPGDDSGNILDFKRKDYRDLINKNSISVFDFRSYLFARQCRMLLKLQRVIEVCDRAQLFITNFVPSIRENANQLVDGFLESWVFSACMNVVNECEPISPQLIAMDSGFIKPYSAVKSDLLLTARRQLDRLGIKHQCLPNTVPFSIYLDGKHVHKKSAQKEEPAKENITNQNLLEAIDSIDAFDKMYKALSSRAIKGYDVSSRPRAALSVHGDIAALRYARGNYEESVDIFEPMIKQYDQEEWWSIENSLLIKCADSQKRLGKINHYVESVLTLLKNSSHLSKEEALFYTDQLLENVLQLDQDVCRQFTPMFSIAVISIIDDATVKSTSVEICIDSHLPKNLEFDGLRLCLIGNAPEQIWFSVEHQELHPGKNTFYLTSQTSTCGNYVVEMCEMAIGRLLFYHNFMNVGQRKRIVRLNHDQQQLYATVQQPNEVCLGERPKFLVTLRSGIAPISNGKLLLEPQTEGLNIIKSEKVRGHLRSTKDGKEVLQDLELETLETGEIIIPDCDANQVLELFVTYQGPYTEYDYKIKTTVSYTTETKERRFISADVVHIIEPLTVTESSIFRETCVFLKVELSCNGKWPVRILGSNLCPSKTYAIERHPETDQWDLTLFPKQVATFVYRLVKRDPSDNEREHLKSKVQFTVNYRTVKNEVETSLEAMLRHKLEEHHLGQHSAYVFLQVQEKFLQSVDYASYGLTDVVHLDNFDAELCESFLLHRDLKTKVQLLDLIEEFFEKHEAITVHTIKEKTPSATVNAVSFLLDVPTSKILHTAELVLSVDKDLLVSEACPCVLRIKQSMYWTANTNDSKPQEDFLYTIDVDYDNWLLSGKKRLRFTSKPGEVVEFSLSLVPLKTGNLLLPSVRVSAVSSNVFSATVYVNSAQQILVKPKSTTATFFIEQQQRFLQPQTVPAFTSSPERPMASPDGSHQNNHLG